MMLRPRSRSGAIPALLALAGVVLALAASVPPEAAVAQPPRTRGIVTLPLAVTIAQHEGAPVVSPAWVTSQLRHANTIFEPQGVRFQVVQRHEMPSAHARLENRRDRHALGRLLHPQRIDVFLVLSLRDVDEPERMRQGVHWRPRGAEFDPRAHFVIVSSIAGETVLAHELGHYFGNGHSEVPSNIMSYDRGRVPPFFDDAQGARIRFSLRRFMRRGELITADAAAGDPAAAPAGGDPVTPSSAHAVP